MLPWRINHGAPKHCILGFLVCKESEPLADKVVSFVTDHLFPGRFR